MKRAMCNLYRMNPATSEGFNFPVEVYPGYPGAVIVDGAVQSMVWGFPLKQISKKTGKPLKPKPVNNARSDKLMSFMWKHSFVERRCLIPLAAWCEAEGPRGAKTRTWLSLPDRDEFCVAGIWRDSGEWGECYSMVMIDSVGMAAQVHNRMPVILNEENQRAWVSASPDDALALCKGYHGEIAINRTDHLWRAK